MSPPLEKNKKVSRACNTCRLKRKKCDGLEPCIFCTETGLECCYSREPRRRGPPSGYLRFTETRVALLETLLGLYIQTSGPQTTQIIHDAVQRLEKESKNHTTQDVWDAYKQNWTASDASLAVNELAAVFAPFSPTENQSVGAKALLPLVQSGQPPHPQQPPDKQPQQQQPPRPRSPSPFPPPPSALYTNESFERSVMPNDFSPQNEHYQQAHEAYDRGGKSNDLPEQPDYRMDFSMDDQLSMPIPLPNIFIPTPAADPPPPPSMYSVPEAAISSALFSGAEAGPPSSEYTGAYWRTAALASPSPAFASLPPPLSPTFAGLALPTSVSASLPPTDLPPPHMRAALLDTYRTVVHPALPILSPSQCASLPALEESPMLLLALCAYAARLAPPAVPTRVAADLWYESACTLLSSALRRAVVRAETVQTLLLLALRDHGRARDALAWRGFGAAVRIAVELGLDGGESTHENESREATPGGDRDPSDEAWKRSLWGVASMLDLFLSIQLGRAPASAEALRPLPSAPLAFTAGANAGLPSPSSSTASASTSVSNTLVTLANASASESADDTAADAELAGHIRALVRIVARVHFCVALGYGVPHSPTSPVTTSSPLAGSNISRGGVQLLRAELTAWHRGLPQRFRVALGGERVPRAVLEVHMLYQVAVGMLARGSGLTFNTPKSGAVGAVNSNPGSSYGSAEGNGTDVEADDAASTFNVLLDKYRPSLPLAGPPVVWLVFAAARAGLQRVSSSKGSVQHSGGGVGTARALQTQLYLLNCREALASMGGTWELARRCARTLERMMEGESGESRPRSGVGKRKRGEGGEGGGRKDESAQGGGGKRLREDEPGATQVGVGEQFDFDVSGLGWGAELDELWGAPNTNPSGLWDTGAWDEGLWGRSVFV